MTPADERGREAVDERVRHAVPAATALSVRDVAIVDSAAMPSAPPICCEVLNRPDARPASAGWTPARAAIEIGTNEKPIPSPDQQEAGQEVTEVRAVDRDLREVHEAGRQR